MKYVDEYRNSGIAKRLCSAISQITTRPWTIMEICGGQTHAIVKYGIDEMLSSHIELVHGPGCPVCVTPLELIDKALDIASRQDVIFCSFGDMLRVPGSHQDLLLVKAKGGDVRIVYSPLDALKIAQQNPLQKVVFFAIGFETTAPANAMSVWQAKKLGVKNFSVLVSHSLCPPVITSLLKAPDNRVQAFLGPGHVCTVMGYEDYELIVDTFHIPIVITGFEPIDILEGIYFAARQLEGGKAFVENQYVRSVRRERNQYSTNLIDEVFEVSDRKWRGMGNIPSSGFKLRDAYQDFDAEKIFDVANIETRESSECISGLVLKGLKKPKDCPAFRKKCTPQNPLGATMVSNEGACAAYYSYRQGGLR